MSKMQMVTPSLARGSFTLNSTELSALGRVDELKGARVQIDGSIQRQRDYVRDDCKL